MNRKLTILHLEDNVYDAELTENSLRKAGLNFEIHVIETKPQYLKALEEIKPDLILSDHSLPSFDSYEALDLMKKIIPETPFILLTGSMSENYAVDCLLSGMDDYILKSNLIRLPSSIRRVISKKRISEEKEYIENLHKELKQRTDELTDSINYAKRIQDSMIPSTNQFKKLFPTSCIYNRPYDLVSGDIYWIAKVKPNSGKEIYALALVDCTGHGIPGAFLTMLSAVLLKDTMNKKDINTPADVLRYLNQKLPEILNTNNQKKIVDGMDIAAIAYDPDDKTIIFAGANRHLWIIRSNNDKKELIELKGNRTSIGLNTPPDYVFDNIYQQLQVGDRIFMCTDGLTDQFGGPKGKKLTSKGLKAKLLETSEYSMAEQEKILVDFFKNWAGDLDQLDDQLFIAIEIE